MLQTSILFVDVKNNGRSILAEAYFNHKCRGALRAFSAGIEPASELDTHILDALSENGIVPDDYCPKPIEIFLQSYSPRIDLIVGFKPVIEPFRLPIFANHPAVTYLSVETVEARVEELGRKRAVHDCFADISLVIDRALATGQLPRPHAA